MIAIIHLCIFSSALSCVTTFWLRSATCSLRAAVSEIVKQRHAVRLRPDANLASILKRVVVPFERFLSIERDCEMVAAKIDTQRVPLARSDLNFGALLLRPLAFDGVINSDVVFE